MPSFCERVSCSAEKVKEKKQKPLRSKGRTSCRTFCYFLVQRDDQHNFSSSITNSNSRKKKRHGKVRNRFSFYANAKEGGVSFFWTNPASKKQLSITSLDKKLPYLRRKPNSFNIIYTYTLLEEKKTWVTRNTAFIIFVFPSSFTRGRKYTGRIRRSAFPSGWRNGIHSVVIGTKCDEIEVIYRHGYVRPIVKP